MCGDGVRRDEVLAAVGGRSRWRGAGWGYVLWPLAIGLVLCGLGAWSGLKSAHDEAVFHAHAVPVRAVIDQLYARYNTASAVPGAALYGAVGFEAGGRAVHARVLLDLCGGTCASGFRVGQVLTVYYNPENPSYAQLRPAGGIAGYWLASILVPIGAIALAAAVINLVTGVGQAGFRPRPDEHPGGKRVGSRQLISIEPGRFEDMVSSALDGLPEDLGQVMRNVAVTVEHGQGPPGLLGLYQGVPLTSRTVRNYAGVIPDRITIYRRAICAVCRSEQEVTEQVRRTVIHEIGHHFGIDDNRLRELGR